LEGDPARVSSTSVTSALLGGVSITLLGEASKVLLEGVSKTLLGGVSITLLGEASKVLLEGVSKTLLGGVSITLLGETSKVLLEGVSKTLLDGLCEVRLDGLCEVRLDGMSKVLFVSCLLLACSECSRSRATIGATVETLATGSLMLLVEVSLARAVIGELGDADVGNTERASRALMNIEILA
jgi:hypothetical protein